MKIKFTSIEEESKQYPPIAASTNIPDWYKKTPSYNSEDGSKKPNTDGSRTQTIKRCMPVFDSMSAGYLILLSTDVYIHRTEKDGKFETTISWAAQKIIQTHSINQAIFYPRADMNTDIPKFINNWIVETPKGYSTLFIPPMHRAAPFQILPGLVDTDVYKTPVNFPFVITDLNFEGIIPAGTPIAHAIPIKRDSWKSTFGEDEEVKESSRIMNILNSTFFDGYKNFYRQIKEYK